MFNRIVITVIAILSLVGCGNGIEGNAKQADPSPVVPQVIQLVVDDPDLVPSVDYGIGWWEEAGYHELVRVESCDDSAPCTHVRWGLPGELADTTGGITSVDRRLVRLNHELTLSYLPSYALEVSVSHELGHVQGIGHSKDPTDLMFINLTPDPKNPRQTICIDGEACRDFS